MRQSVGYLGEEVDFVLANKNKVEQILEVKVSEAQVSKPLKKFKEKYAFEALQIVQHLKKEYQDNGIKVIKP